MEATNRWHCIPSGFELQCINPQPLGQYSMPQRVPFNKNDAKYINSINFIPSLSGHVPGTYSVSPRTSGQ